jgi:hypothetical protein
MFNRFRKQMSAFACEQDRLTGRLTKLLVAKAVETRATKIVFGEPCEPECQRLPYEPTLTTPIPPWEYQEIARVTGRSEQAVAEERLAASERWCKDRLERRALPIWFKVGETYQEYAPAPIHLFFPMLRIMESWNLRRLPWDEAKPDWVRAAAWPSAPPQKGALSDFFLALEDGRVVHAVLGFESSYCLSISINATGEKI